MELTWNMQWSAGNAVIDSDHKNLIAAVNGIVRAIRAGNHPVIPQAFEFLEGWLCAHFANEEKIARVAGLDFSAHRRAQRYSLAELHYLRDCLLDAEDVWSESAARRHAQLLKSWVSGHIGADMPLKPVLQTLGYTFWPGGKEGEINPMAGRTAQLYLRVSDTGPMPCTV